MCRSWSQPQQTTSNMKTILSLVVALCAASLARCAVIERVECDSTIDGDIYGFSAVPVNATLADAVSFDTYANMVVLVVPVASYSTLSTDSFLELNNFMMSYAADPFTVITFHTTEFHRETPETDDEIMDMLYYVRPGNSFTPLFPVFKKTDINGENGHELFAFLKSACSFTSDAFRTDVEYSPLNVADVREPFEKFLVGKDGKPYYRYHATTDVNTVTADIDALLAA